MANFVTIPENNLFKGMNQHAVEIALPDGFVEFAYNTEMNSSGTVSKRKGYMNYAGSLPIFAALSKVGNVLTVQLPTGVDLSTVGSVPVLISGIDQYFDHFTTNAKKILLAGTHTLVLGRENNFSSPFMTVGITESLAADKSNNVITTDGVAVDATDPVHPNVSIPYIAEVDTPVFVYYKARSDALTTRNYTYSANGVNLHTITGVTHGLATHNLGVTLYEQNGNVLTEVIPDSIVIDKLSFNVYITTNTSVSTTFVALIYTTTGNTTWTPSPDLSGKASVILENVDNPFIFLHCYVDAAGQYTKVLPQSVSYDAVTKQYTIELDEPASVIDNFVFCWDSVDVISTSFTVPYNSAIPDHAYVYGLPDSVWADTYVRAGWVNEIDTFNSNTQNAIISGMGGSLFAAEASVTPTANVRSVRLHATTVNSRILAPLFWDNADLPSTVPIRSRAYITHDAGQSHWAKLLSVTYTGYYVKYTVSAPGWVVRNPDGTPTFSQDPGAVLGYFDLLSIQSAGYAINEGEFRVVGITGTPGSDILEFSVVNPQRVDTDWDEADCGGRAGVFTDYVSVDQSEFMVGDQLISSVFPSSAGLVVAGTNGLTEIYVTNLDTRYEYAMGMRVYGVRTSSIIPLVNPLGFPDVSRLVAGDAVNYNGLNRNLTVVDINTSSQPLFVLTNITSGIATPVPTANLTIGQSLSFIDLLGNGVTLVVKNIIDANSILVDAPDMYGLMLINQTITLDEAITWSELDSDNVMHIGLRWFNIPSITGMSVQPFGADVAGDQEISRSTMARDSMFFVTPTNPIRKYDSVNYMTMGLPRWNPIKFGQIISAVGGGDPIEVPKFTPVEIKLSAGAGTAPLIQGNIITMAVANQEQFFTIGQPVRYEEQVAHVQSIDITNHTITTDIPFIIKQHINNSYYTTLTLPNLISYYFRLNYIDTNGAIIASSVMGLGDYTFQLSEQQAIQFFTNKLPMALGQYDFADIDLQVYRTKLNTSAPYYLVKTLKISDLGGSFTDGMDDKNLTDVDEVNSSLKGQEVGTNWDAPACANSITTIDSKLVLANYADHAKADLRMPIPSGYSVGNIGVTVGGRTYRYATARTATTIGHVGNFATLPVALTRGDVVYVMSASIPGWWVVTNVAGSVSTLSAPFTGSEAGYYVSIPGSVPVYLTEDDTNYGTRVQGLKDLRQINTMRRTALAMSTMFSYDNRSLSADAGAEFNQDQLLITQYGDNLLPFSITVTDTTNPPVKLYVNNARADGMGPILCYPVWHRSRLAMSYPKFPEIFDNIGAAAQTESDSIIDVNADDGEEITVVIPFFGKSAFGAAQTDSPLIVFKTSSVYVVNVASRIYKKLDTRGLGCDMPYTVASTDQGLIFANSAGIWRISRDLTLDYVGEYMRRFWQDQVNNDELFTITAHHFGLTNKYKLTAPLIGDVQNSISLVYDHTSEGVSAAQATQTYGSGMAGKIRGAWNIDDNQPITGWVNAGVNEFCARRDGKVYIRRNSGTATDFRDGADPIVWSVTLRASMFGDGAIRKLIRRAIGHFRQTYAATIDCFQSLNTSNNWEQLDSITVPAITATSGLSDNVGRRVIDIAISPVSASCVSFQLKLVNAGIDEAVEFTGVDYKVAGLKTFGISSAAQSSGAGGTSD